MRVAVWRVCECNKVGEAVSRDGQGRARIDRSIRVMGGDRPLCCERDWDRRSARSARPALLITWKEWPGERGPRSLSELS
jgi:hypothetical protein